MCRACVCVPGVRVGACTGVGACTCLLPPLLLFYSTRLVALLQHVGMLRGRGRLTIAEARGIRHNPPVWRDRGWIAAECQPTSLGCAICATALLLLLSLAP